VSAPELLDVVVCCHNDAALLPRLLDALAHQTAGRDAFRVIVVDNGSTDNPRNVAERYRGQLDIEMIEEPVLGLNRARNAGYRHAQSRFVAHVDADSIPDPEWVQAIVDVTSRTDCDLCGGPYRPFYVSQKPRWFEDRFIGHTWGDTARPMQGREHPHGMNMIWKKATVERLGCFRTELGLHGRGLARGDETELVARGQASGAPFFVYYDPRISVQTVVRPEALSFRYWLRRTFVHGRTCRDMWGVLGPGMSRPWPIRGIGAIVLIVAALLRAPFRSRRNYPHLRTFLFDRLLPPLFHLGSSYQDMLRRK
jgi:glycosyltransferase involved in cell wall biosynthesis